LRQPIPGAVSAARLFPPGFIEPCLPTNAPTAPTGPQWAYEIKHDGFRFNRQTILNSLVNY
jgi:ATP-dependent DNA ligase